MHPDPDLVIPAHDAVIVLTVAPKLVGLSGVHVASAALPVVKPGDRVGAAVSVHPKDCRVNRELVPADEKLPELRVLYIVCHETADIGRPPGDARYSDVESAADLIPEGFEGRGDVTRPDHIAVLLRTRPCTPQKVYNGFVRLLRHRIIKDTAVHLGVHVADRKRRAVAVTVVIEIINCQIGFGVVEPEGVDPEIVVILLADLPYVLSCFGVEGVDLDAVSLEIVSLNRTALCLHEETHLGHGVEVLASSVDRGPNRNDDPDTHGVKLVDHGFGVGPVLRVELPLALNSPMEEVDDDLVDLEPLRLILSRNLKHLFLSAVSELALPKSHQVFGEFAGSACDCRIVFKDLLRGVGNRDPVIHLLRGGCDPLGVVLSEGHLADRRIVPEEAVSEG